ncbi:MAG: hypothetical protein HQ478_10175 [Chloroflexi bacterium]|nr:hypothetical protein [Chloroflexota bacterium]
MSFCKDDIPLAVYFFLSGPPLFLWAWSQLGLLIAIELAIPGLLIACGLQWVMERGMTTTAINSLAEFVAPFSLADGALELIGISTEEARRRGHTFVGTEHILLALASRPVGVMASYLAERQADTPRILSALEFVLGRDDRSTDEDPILTPRALRVLELASGIAERRGQVTIEEADIFQAILAEGQGVSAGILRSVTTASEDLRVV